LRLQYQGTLSHPTPVIIPLNHKNHKILAEDPRVIFGAVLRPSREYTSSGEKALN
jgi:hypothetical protein